MCVLVFAYRFVSFSQSYWLDCGLRCSIFLPYPFVPFIQHFSTGNGLWKYYHGNPIPLSIGYTTHDKLTRLFKSIAS